jgi:hypothetical protein
MCSILLGSHHGCVFLSSLVRVLLPMLVLVVPDGCSVWLVECAPSVMETFMCTSRAGHGKVKSVHEEVQSSHS